MLFKINNPLEIRHIFPKFELTSAQQVSLGSAEVKIWTKLGAEVLI